MLIKKKNKIILKGKNGYQLREAINKIVIIKFPADFTEPVKVFNLNDKVKAIEFFNKNYL